MTSECSESDLAGFISFNCPATDGKLSEMASKELGETKDLREQCLENLKKLIKDNKMTCITEDDFLLRFLRTKKFDVQRSLESLRNYTCQRAAFHKRLVNFKPETVRTCLEKKILGILPYRDNEERIVLFMSNDSWDPSICSDDDMAILLTLLTSYIAEDPSSQINGMTVLSIRSIPLSKLHHFLRNAKFVMNFHFNCLPVRFKRIDCIDEPFYFKYILRLIFPLVPKKLTEKIFLHGESRDVLFEHISPSILPCDLGGCLGPLNNDHLVDVILDYLHKLKDEQRHFIAENS